MGRVEITGSKIIEKVLEDIFSADQSILSEIISVNSSDLSFIARQKVLPSGRIDLLYLHKDELLLIELKAVKFYSEIITQISNYEGDLLYLQRLNKLINVQIKKLILVTGASISDQKKCNEAGIELIVFKPEIVLSRFYENFKELSAFLKIQPGDFGVTRLGLLKNTLRHISRGKSVRSIAQLENKSEKTIRNKLYVSLHLDLVSRYKSNFFLTEMGEEFLRIENKMIEDNLTLSQIDLLASFVSQNPFYSKITYTILSLVESVFVLSKSFYPVPNSILLDYFVKSVGKTETWKAPKARITATYIFSNYACELEFLVRVNNSFYLTPKGIQAILVLQLSRSIKLIEGRN